MKKLPYRDHVTAREIVMDGCSRGFHILQIWSELHVMGKQVAYADLADLWLRCDDNHRRWERAVTDDEKAAANIIFRAMLNE